MFTSISQLIKETIQSQRLENRDFSNHPRLYYRKQAITTTNRKHAHTQTRVVPHRAICAARQQNISFSFPCRRLHINAQVFQSSNTHPISSPIFPDLQTQSLIRFKARNDVEKEKAIRTTGLDACIFRNSSVKLLLQYREMTTLWPSNSLAWSSLDRVLFLSFLQQLPPLSCNQNQSHFKFNSIQGATYNPNRAMH